MAPAVARSGSTSLRRAGASGGGVVCTGFVMLSFLRKSQRSSQNTASLARLVGSFRSIDDHLALHNDDCTGYSAIIRDRGDRAATSEQQECRKGLHSPPDRNVIPLAVSAFRTKQQPPALFLGAITAAPG